MARTFFCLAVLSLAPALVLAQAGDPLPSWNDGDSKSAIIEFVQRTTNDTSPAFVPRPERIAVFDNDGTLWSERPIYYQLQFAMDRIKALAAEHPDWSERQPFKAVLEDDLEGLAATGKTGLFKLLIASHSDMTTAQFANIVEGWLTTGLHPRFHRPYTDLAFQPMLEVLDYLRANGYKTFIVSGGGIEFMRPWVEDVYGIPPEQVVGSSIRVKYVERGGDPVLVRLPEVDFVDDKEGKPVGIHRHIGRQPIIAFGNSDGDLEMLQWTAAGKGQRLIVLIHHTDGDREWAYDRESHIGKLDRALDVAAARQWTVVDMKNDWKKIYAFE